MAKDNSENTVKLLHSLKASVFGGSTDALALALGRPTEEIEKWFDGFDQIDEDAREKIHALAQERLT